jgi:hypothetical protein
MRPTGNIFEDAENCINGISSLSPTERLYILSRPLVTANLIARFNVCFSLWESRFGDNTNTCGIPDCKKLKGFKNCLPDKNE